MKMTGTDHGLRQMHYHPGFERRSRRQGSLWRLITGALVATLASALVIGTAAGAGARANGPTISELRVQVMPEFDDPRVLVIIQGRLDISENDLPIKLTLPIPRGAQINQMAIMNTSTGTIESQPFDAMADPDDVQWTLVTYELTSAHFFYEYYYAPFSPDNPERRFAFNFVTPYAIDGLKIEVQQPLKATDFSLVPPATLAHYDETMGFTYHIYEVGTLGIGETVNIDILYRKDSPEPSVTREEIMGSEIQEEGTDMTLMTSSSQDSQGLWVGLSVVGLAGAGTAIWTWTKRRSTPVEHTPTTRKVPPQWEANNRREDSRTDQGVSYCTECGTKLRRAARFCHVCGSQTDAGQA